MALAACRLLAAACVLATLLPLVRSRLWWVRAGDFPRQQIVILGGLAAVGHMALLSRPHGWDMALLAALAAALAWQLAMILPYTRLWRPQGMAGRGHDARSVRLVVVNVLMTNRKVDGLAGSLAEAGPDIVLALETDRWWTERLGELLPEHRHRLLHPLDNTYGMALFSRLELTRAELRFLLDAEVPSIRARVRLRSGEEIGLIGVHPEPPSPTETDSSLPRDAELVLVGREIARASEPMIVAGDLNDVAWSRDQPAVPPAQRADRPAHRPRLLQQLPRRPPMAALAAGPCVLQPGLPAPPPGPPARLRLRPLPDPDRARLPSPCRHPAGARAGRAR